MVSQGLFLFLITHEFLIKVSAVFRVLLPPDPVLLAIGGSLTLSARRGGGEVVPTEEAGQVLKGRLHLSFTVYVIEEDPRDEVQGLVDGVSLLAQPVEQGGALFPVHTQRQPPQSRGGDASLCQAKIDGLVNMTILHEAIHHGHVVGRTLQLVKSTRMPHVAKALLGSVLTFERPAIRGFGELGLAERFQRQLKTVTELLPCEELLVVDEPGTVRTEALVEHSDLHRRLLFIVSCKTMNLAQAAHQEEERGDHVGLETRSLKEV